MDVRATNRFIEHLWATDIIPALQRYVTIPNQSPAFDPHWHRNGYMDQAAELIARWVRSQAVAGLTVDVVRLEGRSPLVFIEVQGAIDTTVLLYGHLDKQPPMEGWGEGLGPRKAVERDGKLYGRGAADDGYAAFAAVAAIKALQQRCIAHARCVIVIEACEESGSYDLPAYLELLADRIGSPGLVICLDSGCGNYERLWITTSLRGLVTGDLTVSILTEGVHSGAASGIVPSTFRVLRHLLSRLEDETTGEILPRDLHVEIPHNRLEQAAVAANLLGPSVYETYPFSSGAQPVTRDIRQLLLNRTWRPALEITGAGGLPALDRAGNVLRPMTAVKLSVRLPPTLSTVAAAESVKHLLEHDPPHGARIECASEQGAPGWNAPAMEPWLAESVNRASRDFFGSDACYLGEGGSIPFVAMFGDRFPHAQFVITGVLGPQSNAHGPNEFLHVPTGIRLTGCIARILADHCRVHSGI